MAGPNPCPIVAMEILIKGDGISPARIVLKFPDPAMHGALSRLITEENMRESSGQFGGDLIQREESSSPNRILDLEVLTKEVMELLERFNEEIVDGKPNGPPPV